MGRNSSNPGSGNGTAEHISKSTFWGVRVLRGDQIEYIFESVEVEVPDDWIGVDWGAGFNHLLPNNKKLVVFRSLKKQ